MKVPQLCFKSLKVFSIEINYLLIQNLKFLINLFFNNYDVMHIFLNDQI